MKFDGLIFVYGNAHLLQVLFTCFQVAQFVTYQTGIAVALGDEGQAPFNGRVDLVEILM